MIPVILEMARDGKGHVVKAECVGCGKCVEVVVDDDDDYTLAARKKEANAKACAELSAQCQERLPWGLAPTHSERFIPRGVSVYVEAKDGKWYPCALTKGTAAGKLVIVAKKDKQEIMHMGVPMDAEVRVVADSDEYAEAAEKLYKLLVQRKYKNARLASKKKAEAA